MQSKRKQLVSRLGLAALLLAMAGQATAAESYRSTRARPRPSVSASCSGFAMLEQYETPGAAAANKRTLGQAKSPAWRREGLRQHLRYYRTACPDADALPLRRENPQEAAR